VLKNRLNVLIRGIDFVYIGYISFGISRLTFGKCFLPHPKKKKEKEINKIGRCTHEWGLTPPKKKETYFNSR
jgi:hypothetical protein